jgi:hypothetical protein
VASLTTRRSAIWLRGRTEHTAVDPGALAHPDQVMPIPVPAGRGGRAGSGLRRAAVGHADAQLGRGVVDRDGGFRGGRA